MSTRKRSFHEKRKEKLNGFYHDTRKRLGDYCWAGGDMRPSTRSAAKGEQRVYIAQRRIGSLDRKAA